MNKDDTCSVENCNTKPVVAKTWCSKHYHRMYRHGTLEPLRVRVPKSGSEANG